MLAYVRPSDEVAADTRGTFTFGERLGLVLVAETACLSFMCVSVLLSRIIYEALRRWRLKRIGWPPPLYMYFVSLLTSDCIAAIGSMMDIRWIHDAGVHEGTFCTAQGIIKQLGDVGVAFATIVIAIQTFGIIISRWSRFTNSPFIGLGVVSSIWLFLALLVGLSVATHNNSDEPLFGNTEYWCSIRSPPYLKTFIYVEYLWLWVAAVTSFLLFSGLAVFVYREHVQTDSASVASVNAHGKANRKLAVQMIFYPLIYLICIMPQSIVRFIQFTHSEHLPPFAASALAAITFASSGFLNVILYVYTRPSLLSRDPAEDDETEIDKFPDSEVALDELEYAENHLHDVESTAGSQSRLDRINTREAEQGESIHDLRRQLDAHERSLGRIQHKLTDSRRRMATS